MKKLISLFLVVILFASCCNHSNDNTTEINFNKIKKTTSVKDVFESVEYIAPKCVEGHLIGSVDKVCRSQSGIYILDNLSHKLFSYDMNGEFLSVLNNRGKGPQEYLNITDFCIKGDSVYILMNRKKIQVYDKDLIYTRTIRNSIWANKIVTTKCGLWLNSHYDYANKQHNSIYRLSSEGKVKDKMLKFSKEKAIINHSPQSDFTTYNDTLFLFQPLGKTIYSVYKNDIETRYTLRHNDMAAKVNHNTDYAKIFRPEVLTCFEGGFAMTYFTMSKSELLLYNRKPIVFSYPKNLTFDEIANKNNLFFPAFCVGADNNTMITIIPPSILLFCKSLDVSETFTNESLKLLINEATEESNTIIALWKIKE